MLGPSGFFIPGKAENSISDSDDLELIHTSEDGFNALYRGCKNGRFFVYKALKEEYRGNIMYEELLKKDFSIGFSLSHSGICQYYAMIDHPAVGSCIVMEWIDGRTLESIISEGGADKALIRKIIGELCDALEYMHRKQVIHRDLKPENIMVTHNGGNVKIIDFGLSDADSYSTFKTPAGTRIYASPELIQGDSIDHRSDIWSLGVIIGELGSRYRHVSKRCLKRDRTKRYGTASEVKRAMLREAYRRFFIWIAILCSSCAIAIGGILYADSSQAPAETAEPPAVEIQPEVREEPQREEPAKPEPVRKESLDATGLEDLFNEAAQQIL